MPRKKWVPKTTITPELVRSREKRKWQIAFRRYVLEKQACVSYAPYFGLDITSIRNWFEMQFEPGVGWDDFAKQWQFDHIIPVTFFDFSVDHELKMCWNFINIRVEPLLQSKDQGNRLYIPAAKLYFQNLYNATDYKLCLQLLEKIAALEGANTITSDKQQAFIKEHRSYLNTLENYSSFEFELLNSGRTIEEVIKEVHFLKKF